MWPWSGVCARSPPRMTAHSQHVHFCPLHLLWSSSQSLLLGGLIHLLLPGLLSHSPVSGIIRKACHSEEESVSCHQGLFPGSHSPPLVLSQLRTERPPWAPSPMALPGRSLPTAWSFPLTSPAGLPEAPPDRDRLSALSWGGLHGVRCKNQQVPVGPPTSSTAASAYLLTSSLWVGPGWALCVLVLISSQCCPRGSR